MNNPLLYAYNDSESLITRLSRAAERCKEEGSTTQRGFVFIDRREREQFYDWNTIYDRVLRSAMGLLSKGIKKGDRVAIILPTCIEFMDVFFACQVMGAIPVALYPPVRLGKLDAYFEKTSQMLESIQVSCIITQPKIERLLGQVCKRYKLPLGIISADSCHQNEKIDIQNMKHKIHIDDIAMAQFSSGTTQNPKPIALTHRHVMSNVDAISKQIPMKTDGIPTGCSWLPLYHDMGLVGCIFPAFSLIGKLVLIPPEVFLTRPAYWLRAISRHKCIISPAPNFAYSVCVDRIKDSDLVDCDLSCWKLALNGAEPVAVQHLREFTKRFEKFGLPQTALSPVYGLAEAALAVTFSDVHASFSTISFAREPLSQGIIRLPNEGEDSIELADVGIPLDGFAVDIRNGKQSIQNTIAPRRTTETSIGEIWISGPSIMDNYLNDLPSPKIDGWLNTGDLGFLYKNKLYISGRAKEILILRGRNHAPHEIEQSVDEVYGVRKGCAVAVGHISNEGERLLLFVESYSKDISERDDLAQNCKLAVSGRTGLHPDLVLILPPGTLPRTSSGKLKRQESLRLFLTDKLIPPRKVTPFLVAGAFANSFLGYIQSKVNR